MGFFLGLCYGSTGVYVSASAFVSYVAVKLEMLFHVFFVPAYKIGFCLRGSFAGVFLLVMLVGFS